jgi:preprotein translocase subunit SecB
MAAKKGAVAKPTEVSYSLQGGPTLEGLTFKAEPRRPIADQEQVQLNFGLRMRRVSLNVLGVQLALEVRGVDGLELGISYTAAFSVENADGDELDRHLRFVAAQLGPSTLYPFLRETVVSLLQKAGLPVVVPPILQLGRMMDPADVKLPPPPDSTEAPSRKKKAPRRKKGAKS